VASAAAVGSAVEPEPPVPWAADRPPVAAEASVAADRPSVVVGAVAGAWRSSSRRR